MYMLTPCKVLHYILLDAGIIIMIPSKRTLLPSLTQWHIFHVPLASCFAFTTIMRWHLGFFLLFAFLFVLFHFSMKG